MRSTLALVTALTIAAIAAAGATPAAAQTRVSSLDELRRDLSPGDRITVVPAAGPAVEGRLMRFGADEMEIRLEKRARPPTLRDVTLPLTGISSLERPRDSARNGAAIGALVGAGAGGAMFLAALVVDRNEIDEWAGFYAGAAAVGTGIGALIGWAIDAGHSKPHIRFDAAPVRTTRAGARAAYPRGHGIAAAVTISR